MLKKQGHVIKDCFKRQRDLKGQGKGSVLGMAGLAEDAHEGGTEQKSTEGEDIQSACACFSGDKWDHECCIHDNRVCLECGHELPLISALYKNRQVKSMPVVQGVLN